MFDPTSRYYNRDTSTYTLPGGREIRYLKRRLLPQSDSLTTLAEVTVNDGDRLDLITARSLGDALQFWRIADANEAMNPFDLASTAGKIIRIPVPKET